MIEMRDSRSSFRVSFPARSTPELPARVQKPGELTKPAYLLIRLLSTPTNRRAPPV